MENVSHLNRSSASSPHSCDSRAAGHVSPHANLALKDRVLRASLPQGPIEKAKRLMGKGRVRAKGTRNGGGRAGY